MSSPDTYNISNGAVTVDFDVVAKNITNSPQTVALNFSAHHILTYNGVDVSDGQPGQPGITFSGPAGTTQALMPGSQAFSETWASMATATNTYNEISRTYNFDACGYYQLDVWAPFKQSGDNGRDRATLASGLHPRARLLRLADPDSDTDRNADCNAHVQPHAVGWRRWRNGDTHADWQRPGHHHHHA